MQDLMYKHQIPPLVSVIIRTADRPEMLREAVASVAAQEYASIQLIVVNDGREDVEAVVQKAAGRLLERLCYVVNHENHGRAQAANRGLENVQGAYVCFLDDDDVILPDHIGKLVQALECEPDAVAVYTDSLCANEHGETIAEFSGQMDQALLIGTNFLPIHSVLFRGSLIGRGVHFDESLTFFEDWDFWIQVSRMGRFIYRPGKSAVYRILAIGRSRSGVGEHGASKLDVMRKWMGHWGEHELAFINDIFVRFYHERFIRQKLDQTQQQLAEIQ
ncbi:MAG: glycosyltransferase family 2 protein, partial [Halothiobacillaceae bacterium]